MRRFKVLGLALMAMFVVGVMTAAGASAESTPLPDIHTALPTDTYPIKTEGKAVQEVEGNIALVNSITKLPAESVTVLIEALELTSLGPVSLTFTETHENKKPTTKCNTVGDATGIVLTTGEYHLVYTSLSPAKALELAALVLFSNPLVILCNEGALTTTVEPPALARINLDPAANGDDTEFETASHCSTPAGTAEISSYFTDTLTELTGVLLKSNISGTGLVNSCEEIKPTLLMTLPSGSTTHFSILG